MLDEAFAENLLKELAELNRNLGAYGPAAEKLAVELTRLNKNFEVVKKGVAQVALLNQIMLSVRRSQGNVAMLKQFMDAAGQAIFGGRR